MSDNKILFLGAGRLGGAILRKWAKSPEVAATISVIEPTPGVGRGLAETLGISPFDSLESLPENYRAETLVIAVKPQVMGEALKGISARLTENALVLSIAAGISIDHLQELTNVKQPVIRCMPNLAAEVGFSTTVAVASPEIREHHKSIASSILTAIGSLHWIDNEDQLHAVTAISGSGPAYVFALAEALTAAAHKLGLPDDLGHNLAIDTIIGAAALLMANSDPTDLRKQVTSPAGTTEAALKILQGDPGLDELVLGTCRASDNRSRELAENK